MRWLSYRLLPGDDFMLITLTEKVISVDEALAAVRHPSCGATAVFLGDIRRENHGRKVLGLEYEVYERFFFTEVERIEKEIYQQWKIHQVALVQRVGKLDVSETGLAIAVSSPHRREALAALSYLVEEFKKRAPVWKKEYYEDQAEWIHC